MPMSPLRALYAAAAAALVGILLSSPAAAGGTLYHWVTDDGTYAFTDDEKKVPERYRDQVKVKPLRGLDDYERFTPAETGSARDELPPVSAPPPRMRAYEAPQAESPQPAPARAPTVSIRAGGENSPIIDITPEDDSGPIVIEKRRFTPEGSAVTRTNTIVRQGDRILTIIKPESAETNVSDIDDEEDLER